MLPTSNEDNAANLNAAFVTDNSLEEENVQSGNGNIEAETNKSDNDSNNSEMENFDETVEPTTTTTPITVFADVDDSSSSSSSISSSLLVANEQLTIENNEEPVVNDNFNESTVVVDDVASAVSSELSASNSNDGEFEDDNLRAASMNDTNAEFIPEIEDTEAETEAETEAATETVTQPTQSEFEHENNDDNDDDNINNEDDDISDDTEVVVDNNSSVQHLNYAINKQRQREDVSSSDDEDGEHLEMSPEFNSEWENLAEDLANANDVNNDLSNDIDVYDTAVPVDLSNDIAVNDVAAAQLDFPHNPDAEFVEIDGVIDVDSGALMNSTMPKFEKLSIASAMNPTSYQSAPYSQNMK